MWTWSLFLHWSRIDEFVLGLKSVDELCHSPPMGIYSADTSQPPKGEICMDKSHNVQVTQPCSSTVTSGGQISTKHLTTSIRPFFATCRLPQYPEFWRCVEPGILFLGPHCKRSLKSLDTLLKVPMRNTQLLPRPRKMVAVVLNIFFLGYICFSYEASSVEMLQSQTVGNEGKSSRLQRRRLSPPPTKLSLYL